VLAGGVLNAGAVVRLGDVVGRPAQPYVRAIHQLLRGLAARGLDGVPSPVGVAPDGREELGFVPGEVAVPPFPEAMDTRLSSEQFWLTRGMGSRPA
jgi:hypothetical protein